MVAAIRLEAPALQLLFLLPLTAIGQKSMCRLLTIQHGEMGKGRMQEDGEWHRFLEVFVSRLALLDKVYVSEMRHCLKPLPNFIRLKDGSLA